MCTANAKLKPQWPQSPQYKVLHDLPAARLSRGSQGRPLPPIPWCLSTHFLPLPKWHILLTSPPRTDLSFVSILCHRHPSWHLQLMSQTNLNRLFKMSVPSISLRFPESRNCFLFTFEFSESSYWIKMYRGGAWTSVLKMPVRWF